MRHECCVLSAWPMSWSNPVWWWALWARWPRTRSSRHWCMTVYPSRGLPSRSPALRICSCHSPGRASMSAADLATSPAARPLRHVSTRFLRSELRLIFGRRRNQAGLGILAVVPLILAITVKLSTPRPGHGPDFLASITSNGLFVALASLSIELALFLPLAVGTIAGDSVAGEANIGTLRYLLAVPVHRTRLLAVKFAAITIFSMVATVWVSLVGATAGLALFGGGEMTMLSGGQIGMGPAVLRVVTAAGYALVFWLAAWARFSDKDVTG